MILIELNEKKYVKIEGKPNILLAELTVVIQELYKIFSEKEGEETSKCLLNEVFEVAFLSDDELESRKKEIQKKIIQKMFEDMANNLFDEESEDD